MNVLIIVSYQNLQLFATLKYTTDNFGGQLRVENNNYIKFKDCQFLRYCIHQPYKKPNDIPTYIIVNSNHPPNIIKASQDSISKRISNISSDEAIFHNAAPFYIDVLSASG